MKRKALSIIATVAITATAFIPFANANAWETSAVGDTAYVFSREINNVDDNVTNTFTYTITADASNPTAVAGVPATTTIVFNNVAPVNNRVTATGIIDLSSATFTALGDYGFIIKETGSSDPSNYPLSSDTYTAWVSVRNVTDGGALTGDHEAQLIGVTDALNNKVEVDPTGSHVIFSDGQERTYLEVKAIAKGNSADPNECFKFEVHLDGDEEAYKVTTESTCKNNIALLTADEIPNNNIITVYLKHNETAYIGKNDGNYQIPIGLRYAIVVDGSADYKTYIDDSTIDSKTSAVKTTVGVNDRAFSSANVTYVVNVKEITPKTGLDRSIWPFVIVAVVGAFGALFVIRNKHSANKIHR